MKKDRVSESKEVSRYLIKKSSSTVEENNVNSKNLIQEKRKQEKKYPYVGESEIQSKMLVSRYSMAVVVLNLK